MKEWYNRAKTSFMPINEMLRVAKKQFTKPEQARLLIFIAYDLDLVTADVVAVNSKWKFDV